MYDHLKQQIEGLSPGDFNDVVTEAFENLTAECVPLLTCVCVDREKSLFNIVEIED